MTRLALAVALLTGVLQTPTYAHPQNRLNRLPLLMLWAWERPEDLRDLEPGVGVAFLAQTLRFDRGVFRTEPRRQPLRVSPTTALVAVTRIESDQVPLQDNVASSVAAAIVKSARLPRVVGLQIDFDAVVSQRPFYRDVLRRVRADLDPAMSLSMTALASWCVGDHWLNGLPVDEAIPMLFRLGPLNEPYRDVARSSSDAHVSCRQSLGTSLDEPLYVTHDGRRLYVFNPRPWTISDLRETQRRIR